MVFVITHTGCIAIVTVAQNFGARKPKVFLLPPPPMMMITFSGGEMKVYGGIYLTCCVCDLMSISNFVDLLR